MTATTRSPRPRRLLAAAVLLLLLLAGCSGADEADTAGDDAAGEEAAPDRPASADGGGGEVGLADSAAATDAAAAAPAPEDDVPQEGAAGEAADEEAQGDAAPALPADGTAATGERIIKEGTVTVEVAPGDFDVAFGQVVDRAQALGGHVSGTSSSTDEGPDGEPLTSGQVTIRVPVRAFEDLLASLGEAGEVVERDINSQDVTAEFVDLESRRRNLEAQERFYLGLLDQAASVPDAIAVQQQLDGIQTQIEQITGRLNLLDDRSSFSTLTVRIREQGADPVAAEPGEEPGGLTPYIDDAVDTFITTVGAIIVFTTFVAPFALLALLGYAVYRLVRRRRTSAPAATSPEPPTAAAPPVPVGADPTAGPAPQD